MQNSRFEQLETGGVGWCWWLLLAFSKDENCLVFNSPAVPVMGFQLPAADFLSSGTFFFVCFFTFYGKFCHVFWHCLPWYRLLYSLSTGLLNLYTKLSWRSDETRFSGTLSWSFYLIFYFCFNYMQYNWGENLVCLQPGSKLLD